MNKKKVTRSENKEGVKWERKLKLRNESGG
jgi:hypothetical protein